MYIKNFFRLAEWEINDLLSVVVTLLTIYFFCIFSKIAGLDLSILEGLVGFIIILFIPGTLFLRIIKFDSLKNNLELILYTLGLSLVIIMLLGFTLNILFPYVGIHNPMSSGIYITAMNFLIILMSYLAYLKDDGSYKTPLIDSKSFKSNSGIFLILLPFISIIGSYLMTNYQINLFSIILISLICIIGLMVGFQRVLSPKIYPLAILCISLALLFHKSLISNYIWGWDISFEYYMAQGVIQNGYWFMDFPNNYNSMLSVVVLAPALSYYSGLNMVWVLKIIYPFIFAFLPVGLYFTFKKQTTAPIAFLSVFFFISLFTYYTEMLSVVRQMIAEYFLVLILLLMVSRSLNTSKRSVLAVLFSISVVFSHYGLSYILLFIMLFSMFILVLENPLKFARFLSIELIPQKLVSGSKTFKNNLKNQNNKIANSISLKNNYNINNSSNRVKSEYMVFKKVEPEEKPQNFTSIWKKNRANIKFIQQKREHEDFVESTNSKRVDSNGSDRYRISNIINPIFKLPGNIIYEVKNCRIEKKLFSVGKILVFMAYLIAWQTYYSGSVVLNSNGNQPKPSPGMSLASRIRRKIRSIRTQGMSYQLRNFQNYQIKIPKIDRPPINTSPLKRPRFNKPKIQIPGLKIPELKKPGFNLPKIKITSINRPKIKFGSYNNLMSRLNKHGKDNSHHLFNGTLVMLFITFLFTWYIYTSSSSAMISILNVGNDIFKNIINLMDPNASQGLSLVLAQQKSFFRDIHKYLYLTSQFFVFLGLIAVILNQTHLKFQKEFKTLALAAFVLLVAGILVPFLASQMNTSRLLHIALILLAPFLVVGIFFGLKILRKKIKWLKPSFSLKLVSIYLIIFLLMDSGLAYQFAPHEEEISISLSTTYDFPKFNDRELQSAKWLKNEFGEKGIYADKHRSCVLRSIYPDCEEVPPYLDLVQSDYYIYFGTINIQKNGLYIYKMTGANVIQEIGYSNPVKLINDRPKIYDNGGSIIYGRSG